MALKSINPANGAIIDEYDAVTDEGIDTILALAAERFISYRRTSFNERATWMRRAAELLRERVVDYSVLMTSEMGKPIGAARNEVEKCAWVCEYYADSAEGFLANEAIETDASRSYVAFHPIGPVLAIMPWNFPLWQCFRFAAPALMAGNVGLLKHAGNVPGCSLAIESVFRDAGFPQGCFQSILVESQRTPEVVARIIEDSRVAAVTLTGSEPAGRNVGAEAGTNLKKVVLELGGSDPFVVMPSADLDKAIDTAVTARTINNGQSCIAAKRFIVHADIAGEFERRMADRFDALQVGDPADEATDIGPLAEGRFVDQLHEQVVESVKGGARVVTGGRRVERPGAFYAPTVLADVGPGMPAYDEETFGPVAALITVNSIDEAISKANDTRFGLGASAWTGESTEQQRFVRELAAGSVFINGMVKSDPRLPFGGIKASGIGRELGEFGIREFVNIKTIWIA
jgi:succinate-semialdehyde dehydrogenase/glutarate-semialdehyde dehydrogenase